MSSTTFPASHVANHLELQFEFETEGKELPDWFQLVFTSEATLPFTNVPVDVPSKALDDLDLVPAEAVPRFDGSTSVFTTPFPPYFLSSLSSSSLAPNDYFSFASDITESCTFGSPNSSVVDLTLVSPVVKMAFSDNPFGFNFDNIPEAIGRNDLRYAQAIRRVRRAFRGVDWWGGLPSCPVVVDQADEFFQLAEGPFSWQAFADSSSSSDASFSSSDASSSSEHDN